MSAKTCFVIAPIGEPDSETRKRSDQVLKHIITPAVTERGYEPMRADQISEPGMITSQVIQHVIDDPLVVADLTERNPNVFYELALRHALRKPLIQLIRKGEQIPFDVAGMRTITVDHRDLDSAEQTRREIIKQIDSAEKATGSIETPISVTLELQSLRQSDDPQQRSLADIISAVTELRTAVAGIEGKLTNMEGFILQASPQPLSRGLRIVSRLPTSDDLLEAIHATGKAAAPGADIEFLRKLLEDKTQRSVEGSSEKTQK